MLFLTENSIKTVLPERFRHNYSHFMRKTSNFVNVVYDWLVRHISPTINPIHQ